MTLVYAPVGCRFKRPTKHGQGDAVELTTPRTRNSLRDRTYPQFKWVVSVYELQDRCGMTLLRIVLVVADCRHHCRQLTTRRGLAPHTSPLNPDQASRGAGITDDLARWDLYGSP